VIKSYHRPYTRSERVGDELRHILANIFISQIHISNGGLLTVTKVKITDDLKIANIYISFFKNKVAVKKLMQLLIAKKKMIRHYLGLQLKLKYVPELRFYYDDTMEHAEKIHKLINKIHIDD